MIVNVHCHEDTLIVVLSDGCEVRAPLSWHPRLRHGTDAERANWRLIGNGVGVHWPDLDEDIGVKGLVLGRRARESEASLAGWMELRGCISILGHTKCRGLFVTASWGLLSCRHVLREVPGTFAPSVKCTRAPIAG